MFAMLGKFTKLGKLVILVILGKFGTPREVKFTLLGGSCGVKFGIVCIVGTKPMGSWLLALELAAKLSELNVPGAVFIIFVMFDIGIKGTGSGVIFDGENLSRNKL
jgi:hypothetical protein